jgi:hypothetical protein
MIALQQDALSHVENQNLSSKHRQKENVTQEILKLQLGNSSENGAQIS